MITRKIKLTIPQYRERKEIFDALGYEEISCVEKGNVATVVQRIDNTNPNYPTLRKFEKDLYKKGPTFFPIILFVFFAFTLLSTFAIFLAAEKDKFDLVSNALYFLLPAFLFLGADVIYTYFYFKINRRIIEKGHPTKADVLAHIEQLKKF